MKTLISPPVLQCHFILL